MTDKFTKQEVDYSRGMIHSHCGKAFTNDQYYCRHYQPKTMSKGTCEVVDGEIITTMWCKKWAKQKPSE